MLTVREKLAAIRARRFNSRTVPNIAEETEVVLKTPVKVNLPKSKEHQRISPSGSERKSLTLTRGQSFRYDARASRLLWRQAEMQRARKLAARNVMNSDTYAFMTAPIPDEEKPLHSLVRSEDNNSEDDENDDDDGDDDCGHHDQDEEERALQTAQLEEALMSDNDEDEPFCDDLLESFQEPSKQISTCIQPSALPDVDELSKFDVPKKLGTTEVQELKCFEPISDTILDQESEEANPTASEIRNEDDNSVLREQLKHPSILQEVARNLHGLLDAEAEEDGNNDNDGVEDADTKEQYTDDETSDIDENDGFGIVPDCEQKEGDVFAIANFHHQWEMKQEQEKLEATTSQTCRFLDNGAERSDSGHRLKTENAQIGTSYEAVRRTEDCGVEHNGDGFCDSKDEKIGARKDVVAEYMEAMFLRDDSHSKMIDATVVGGEEATYTEAKREQQRVLWKTRQKAKERFSQTDDDSLGYLELFGDDDNTKTCSQNIRKKLEKACRPAVKTSSGSLNLDMNQDGNGNSKKRPIPESVPEWLKQKACLERRQRKRQRSVAVANWSFDSLAAREKAMGKLSKSSNSNSGPSLGASHVIRRSRTVMVENTKPRRVNIQKLAQIETRRQVKVPSSFKGLLHVLGKQAEKDP